MIVSGSLKICRTALGPFVRRASASAMGLPLEDGPSVSPPSVDREKDISPRVRSLVDQIAELSLVEVSDLNFALKKRLNIPDTPAMAMSPEMFAAAGMFGAQAGGAAGAQTSQADADDDSASTKTSYAVRLAKFDDAKKIALIKEVRSVIPGMNLVQTKKLIESAPVEIKGDMGKTEADELKALLEKHGAECEVI
ncbi:hypothetical protein niasHS_002114 [Heterodera schachtii]|uniref:Uncharacterized protein n=1 Tax=Heterodera schachtii TaxID=97005 RepID=A0ABD2KMB4_HETSC